MSANSVERRVAPRVKATLDAKLLFKPSPQATPLTIRSTGEGLRMVGSTHDLSETGVGLVVSARNIDRYVTSPEYVVLLEVLLPSGPIIFTVKPVRHGRFTVGKTTNAYFIGAEITEISPSARERLMSFLKSST